VTVAANPLVYYTVVVIMIVNRLSIRFSNQINGSVLKFDVDLNNDITLKYNTFYYHKFCSIK
jgi:hypothetical protein